MGFFVLLILIIGIVVIVSASNSGKGSAGGYHSGYIRNYDEDEYEDCETRAAMGERNYFTDDSARDYDSYYAQVADDAMMGDESAMEEMRIYAKNSGSKKMIARPHYLDKLIAKVVKIILLVSGPKGKDVQIGYYGERLVLKAQELGLNTCWVAMSYNKIDLGIVRYHFETVSGHKVL